MNTVNAQKTSRKIIHIDADCFFAAVEMREDASLRGRPLAVGGSEQRRGVISTCNYEARTYGVRSAMASAYAKKLCPDLVIVPPNMALYQQTSHAMRAIFGAYSDLVEPLSLDEAFIDVSNSELCAGSATLIAQEIRARIFKELGITVSAGVAPNKFLAKVASDWQKPDGLTVITPDQINEFVKALPITRIFGVGRVTAQKINNMGIHTCGDLQALSELELTQRFSALGLRLYQLSRGIDNRPVKSDWRRKSLSVEHTFAADIPDVQRCINEIPALFQQLHTRMRRLDKHYRITKSFVKLKFSDFSVTTIERGVSDVSLAEFRSLCHEAFARRQQPVRLIGLGVRLVDQLTERNPAQLELFDPLVVDSLIVDSLTADSLKSDDGYSDSPPEHHDEDDDNVG